MPRSLVVALESLDQLKSVLKVVAALGDGAVSVPGLRFAAGAAIEIIDIAQAMTKNRKDAIEVARSAAERTSSLLDAFKGRSKDDIPLDLQEDVVKYSEKLELVQRILYKHSARTPLWRRIISRESDRDEINSCKDILNEGFQVFEVSLTLKLHTRLPDLLMQLQTYIVAAQTPAPQKLSIIRREELDLVERLRLKGNTAVFFAEYKGTRVVVRKYCVTEKARWAADIDTWLEAGAWQPHYLQIIGQSEDCAPTLHVVFQDSGVPVQAYIEHECRDGVKKCALEVLSMVIQFASAADELLCTDQGGCKLDTAQVCLRSSRQNHNGPNFVLAHFDPSNFYKPTASDQQKDDDAWESFVNLITKAITGESSKPNYVTGECDLQAKPVQPRGDQ